MPCRESMMFEGSEEEPEKASGRQQPQKVKAALSRALRARREKDALKTNWLDM